jgi:adenine deaminase
MEGRKEIQAMSSSPNILKPRTPAENQRLVDVALGNSTADLAIVNASVVNVYTREVLQKQTVLVADRWIAYVGGRTENSIGEKTEVIDAEGQPLVPGFIDGHTHMASLYTADEFIRYAVPGGTTTVVTESLEPYPVCGVDGVVDFLESLRDQPIKIFATAPAMVSISHAARGIREADLQRLLRRDDILGLGESYWQQIVQEPGQLLPSFTATMHSRKTIEGHSAGASDRKLAAYVAAGASSCHEPINAEQVLERLRMGLAIMVREGSIRRDLHQIARIRESGIDLRRLILSTDGVSPEDLVEKGYMDYVVQKAVDSGFDPLVAVQMATLNVAEHFGMSHLIGGIAPGRCADLLLLPELVRIRPEVVISDGRIVARDRQLTVAARRPIFTHASMNSIRLPRDLTASDFLIRTPENKKTPTVRIIEMVTDLVTRESHLEVATGDGQIGADPDRDLLKLAAVDRSHVPGKMFVGLIKGLGLRAGAAACSAAWDSSDIIVAGADDADMAAAVNRIRALQGGAVLCRDKRVIREVALPIFGIMATQPIEELVAGLRGFKQALRSEGIDLPDPLLTLITLTGAAIPYLRICEEGLVNLKDGKTVGLFL